MGEAGGVLFLWQLGRWTFLHVAIETTPRHPRPDIPSPTEGHGWVLKNGMLEPTWTEEKDKVLPPTVIGHLLNDFHDAEDEDEECLLQY